MVQRKQKQPSSNEAGPPSEETSSSAKDPYWVDALAQGLAVLHVFDGDRPALTLPEIAARLGWSRTKPFRFVHTLEKLGYLARDESGRAFRLTSMSMQLGFAYLSRVPLVEMAQPVLDRLRTQVGASTHLAILERNELVYIAQARVQLPTAINIHVGSRLPAYATSIGRILLAHQSDDALDEIVGGEPLQARTPKSTVDPNTLRRNLRRAREQGYVFNDGEFQEGIRSVAAPILDARGNAVAGINATATSYVFDDKTVSSLVIPAVCNAASELSRSLGYAERDRDGAA